MGLITHNPFLQFSLIEHKVLFDIMLLFNIKDNKLNTRGTYDGRQMADRTGFSATTKNPTT